MSVLEPGRLIEAFGALAIVLALLACAALILRQWRGRGLSTAMPQLVMVESLALDARHRLVRVRDGDGEHLLLLGPSAPLVVDHRRAQPEPAS